MDKLIRIKKNAEPGSWSYHWKELKALPAEGLDKAIRLLKAHVELRDDLSQQLRLYKDVMKGALQRLAPKAFPYLLYRNDES